ncbi:MAG: hypothetical protein AB1646_16870 [Thermodesulfobacteriota bacterium]
MEFEHMTKEQLVTRLRELNAYMENVIVFWGGKREFRETFREVAENRENDYTREEARTARILLDDAHAYDEFIQMIRDSFDRGGISYVISEKISALMEEVCARHRQSQ